MKYFDSREKAQFSIEHGIVEVQGVVIKKSSFQVDGNEDIKMVNTPLRYVSLGGLKLEKAIHDFDLTVENLRVLDIGSSTGGFTDCLLQHGAAKVYAVDVGTDQMHPRLKNDPKVMLYENTDIRNFNVHEIENELVDLIVIDVSFISLTSVFPFLSFYLKERGKIIALVKPQFEMIEKQRFRNGIIKDASLHKQALSRVIRSAEENNFKVLNQTEAPIIFDKKNKEFLLLLEK